MPTLDWNRDSVLIETRPHSKLETQLEVRVGIEMGKLLLSELRQTCFAPGAAHGARELCLTLPQGWVLFFKSRESGSRMMLAHPEQEEWVATISIDEAHLEAIENQIRAPSDPGETRHEFSRWGRLEGINNFELVLATQRDE